jgi:hypothetical protein
MRKTIAFFIICRTLIGSNSVYAGVISLACSGTYTHYDSKTIDAAFNEALLIDIEHMTITVPIYGTIPIKKKTDTAYNFTKIWSENGRVVGNISGALNRYTGGLVVLQEPAGKLFTLAGMVEGNCRVGRGDSDRMEPRQRRGARRQVPYNLFRDSDPAGRR